MKGQRITPDTNPASTETLKQCCAKLYESDLAKILLGDTFHPGGLRLTERLGSLLRLTAESRVLDVASGNGSPALFLAKRFGCQVIGIDYSGQNVADASELASARGLSSQARFERGDAENLPFPDKSFDAIICECAFCTFANKTDAAREFARVLRPGGRVGLSDLTRGPTLPKELDSLLAWIAYIADAQPVDQYADSLRSAAFDLEKVELHDEALFEMVQQIRKKLLSAEVLARLKKLVLPGVDFTPAKHMAQSTLTAIQKGQLGYAALIAVKPCAFH
jgi:ubiquinone/menaquinone biosynthesis C-methylase UbiE